MKKRNIASLIAVAAVATSIGTATTAYKGAMRSSNNVFLSSATEGNGQYAVVINGHGSLDLLSSITNGKKIGSLSGGEMLSIQSKVANYYKVVVEETGETGYIDAKNVELIESGVNDSLQELSENGQVINVTTNVRVRKQPTMSSSVVNSLQNGDNLHIIGKQGEWYEVDFDGNKGFVYFEYIESQINKEDSSKKITLTKPKSKVQSGNEKLLANTKNSTDISKYFGNYTVSSALGTSYSSGRENAIIGHEFTMNSNLFSMENIPGSMNYNIKNPSYQLKKQNVEAFKNNYGYNPSEIGLKGNSLTELVVAGNNSASNNKYALNSFGSNSEMIFYIEDGKLILFEPTNNSAYICENSNIYEKGIMSFDNLVNSRDNDIYNINQEQYKNSNKFSISEANLYNRIFNIVKEKIWVKPIDDQRTMTLDMGTTYNKGGKYYYSVYLYDINGSNKAEVSHCYISTDGDILPGSSFKENNDQSLSYNDRKNIITKIAMEYMSQSTDNNIYSFNCNLGKSIVRNGVRYYQVNAWSSNPLYPGGQSLKEGDMIYVSPYGNVINTYKRTIELGQNNPGSQINGVNRRSKNG